MSPVKVKLIHNSFRKLDKSLCSFFDYYIQGSLSWTSKIMTPAFHITMTDTEFETLSKDPAYVKEDSRIILKQGTLNIPAEKINAKNKKEQNNPKRKICPLSFRQLLKLPYTKPLFPNSIDIHYEFRQLGFICMFI